MNTDNPPQSILDEINELEQEKAKFIEQKKEIEDKMSKPTIKEVSFEEVQVVLKQYSKILHKIEPEKQKDLLIL